MQSVNTSRIFRYAFFGILGIMAVIMIYGLLNRPTPLTPADMDATVQAGIAGTRAAIQGTPNLQATIDAEIEQGLRVTPTPTAVPSPLDGVGGAVSGVWNFFGFGGLFTQVLCCLLIPGLLLLGVLRDPPRPR
ncbi:MAG: hypothetical protein MUF87_14205 [Anaerolineae bacterium]|jgi:hypothetical protein|nr:hypothetical protein [Anaerolineae bacterium]